MDGDGDLELVIGLTIYNVNAAATTLTVMASRPEYFVRNVYNANQCGRFQSGRIHGCESLPVQSGCHGNNTTIFFWDVQNNTLRTYSDQDGGPSTGYEHTATMKTDGKTEQAA